MFNKIKLRIIYILINNNKIVCLNQKLSLESLTEIYITISKISCRMYVAFLKKNLSNYRTILFFS